MESGVQDLSSYGCSVPPLEVFVPVLELVRKSSLCPKPEVVEVEISREHRS